MADVYPRSSWKQYLIARKVTLISWKTPHCLTNVLFFEDNSSFIFSLNLIVWESGSHWRECLRRGKSVTAECRWVRCGRTLDHSCTTWLSRAFLPPSRSGIAAWPTDPPPPPTERTPAPSAEPRRTGLLQNPTEKNCVQSLKWSG